MKRTSAAALGAAVALAGIGTFVPSSPASAEIPSSGKKPRVHVVRPGHSIQAAVNSARPGDIVQLKAGRYDGGVLVRKPLTIRGAGDRTVLKPGRRGDHCAKAGAAGSGICVVGRAGHPVKGVTITKLSVQKFRENGIYGNYTDRLTVKHVLAKRNGEYGIAEFRSTRGRFVHNRTIDNRADAGLYVGDIANARGTVIAENHSSGNALGLLVRHARHIKVWGNTFTGNCTGIALVDDGQKGGQGNTRIWDNKVSENNRFCPAQDPAPPALGGTGILFFGGDHNRVEKNTVLHNRGRLPYSGGIVLFPGVPPQNRPARHNLIKANKVRGNAPYDLVDRSGSKTNRFRHNKCTRSSPPGLC